MKLLFIMILLINILFANGIDKKSIYEYFDNKEYKKAILLYPKKVTYYKKYGQKKREILATFWAIRSYERLNQPKKALTLYVKMLSEYQERDDMIIFYYSYYNMACEYGCGTSTNKDLLKKAFAFNNKGMEFLKRYNHKTPYRDYHKYLGDIFAQKACFYKSMEDKNSSIIYGKKSIREQKKYIALIFEKYNVEEELTELAESYFSLYGCDSDYKKESIVLYKDFLKYLEGLDTSYPSVEAMVYAKLAESMTTTKDKMDYYFKAVKKMDYDLYSWQLNKKLTKQKQEKFINYHEQIINLYDEYNNTSSISKDKIPKLMLEFLDTQREHRDAYVLAKSYLELYRFYNNIEDFKRADFSLHKAYERIKVAIKENKLKRTSYNSELSTYMNILIRREYREHGYSKELKKLINDYLYFMKIYYWDKKEIQIEGYNLVARFFVYESNDVAEKYYLKGLVLLEKLWNRGLEERDDLYRGLIRYFGEDSPFSIDAIKRAIVIEKRLDSTEDIYVAESYAELAQKYKEANSSAELQYEAYKNAIENIKLYIKNNPKDIELEEEGDFGFLWTLESYSFSLARLYLENHKEREFLNVMNGLKKYKLNRVYIEETIANIYEDEHQITKMFKHLDMAVSIALKSLDLRRDIFLYREEKYLKYKRRDESEKFFKFLMKKSQEKGENRDFYLGLVSKIYLLVKKNPILSLSYMKKANRVKDKKYQFDCKNLSNDYSMIDVKLELEYEYECEDSILCRETDDSSEVLDKRLKSLKEVCR